MATASAALDKSSPPVHRRAATAAARRCKRVMDATPSRLALRRVRLELASARAQVAELLDTAPVGYLCLDTQGRIEDVNPAGAALLATPADRLLGRTFTPMLDAAHQDEWRELLARVGVSGGSGHMEAALRRPDGESVDILISTQRAAGLAGPPVLRATLTNITHRRLAEADRRIAEWAVQGREAERRHLAHALHERLGQGLSALKMDLTTPLATSGLRLSVDRVHALLAMLDELIATVRRLAAELGPLMLDDLGLGAAMDWLARDSSRRLAVEVALDLPAEELALDDRTSAAMYRIMQESLCHLTPRAGARDIQITMKQDAGGIVLNVLTDRTGQDEQAEQPLHDWVHLLGGRLKIEECTDGRRKITIVVPRSPVR